MPITVVQAQARVAQRLGEYAGLVDLADLVAVGLRSLGVDPASADAVTDADLESVTAARLDQLYEVAQAEGLERILGNLDPLRLRSLGIEEDPRAIADRLRPIAAALRTRVERNYGVGLQPPAGGVFTYDFAQRGDETRSGGEF